MKNIVTLTVLLMSLLTYSQITPTKEQQKKILQVTTPEKLIEYSKGLSNEKRQKIVIDSLYKELSKKDNEIIALINKHKKEISALRDNNQVAIDSNEQIAELESINNKKILKDLKLYGFLEVQELEFENPIIGLDLLYDLKKIQLGISGFYQKNTIRNNNYGFSVKLRYSFF